MAVRIKKIMKTKSKSRTKYTQEQRKKDARKWLMRHLARDLVDEYSRRYKISRAQAEHEVVSLGFRDEIRIQGFERDGIEWEYKVDGYSGDMKVVPKGTPDWELHLY